MNEFGVSGEDLQQADGNGVIAIADETQANGNSENVETHAKSE